MKLTLTIFLTFFISVITIISGCTSVSAKKEFKEVQQLFNSRTNLDVRWNKGSKADAELNKKIQSMFVKPLLIDEVVQIALLNNPSIQAILEGLGIAQADLVQAGLLKNLVFEASFRQPKEDGKTNVEYSVKQDFLDILFYPLRQKMAKEEFEGVKFAVTDKILKLTSEIKSAYFNLQASQDILTLRRSVLEASEAASELANRQKEAGNIQGIDLANQEAAYYDAQLEYMHAQVELKSRMQELARLMGLTDYQPWEIVNGLPELPAGELTLKELQAKASGNRLDLSSLQHKIEVLKRKVTLTKVGIVPSIEAGASTERDTDSSRVTGPRVEVEVPLFDRNQGEVAKAKAELRQAEQQLIALEQDIQLQVSVTYENLISLRKMVEYYKEKIVPTHQKAVEITQQHYNYMLKGVYELLQAKKDEILAEFRSIETLRDYWKTRAELEYLISEKFPTLVENPKEMREKIPEEKEETQPMNEIQHQHHHHGGD